MMAVRGPHFVKEKKMKKSATLDQNPCHGTTQSKLM